MIGSLFGNVVERNGETLILDVGGVGYEVTASAAVLEQLPEENKKLRLTVFTDVKENSISLFGFRDGLERQVFLLLRKVKGIGSRTALTVLSSLGAEGVLTCVGKSDISRLKQVPGVGNKTAERLIIELRESVGELAAEIHPGDMSGAARDFAHSGKHTSRESTGAEQDAVLALEKLGFPAERARSVVTATVAKFSGSAASKVDAGELLRLALGNI